MLRFMTSTSVSTAPFATLPSPLDLKPRVMGIVNVTPDSFSDGGRFRAAEAALAQAHELAAEGADIIDIGGESTRPGYTPVPVEEELARVIPVLEALAGFLPVPVSIDTNKAAVAKAALARGVTIVNDIWGLQGDPAMAGTVADHGASVVVMHNRATKDEAVDIADDMHRFFETSLAIAARAGIPPARLILDPGIGFGKTSRQQLQALAALPRLRSFGLPLLVGLSRKSFLGRLTQAPVNERLNDTIAANLAALSLGASIFRVHDVAEHVTALAVFAAICPPAAP
jgi:dihydropteroate synthase